MLREIYEHLVADGETNLGVSVVKGFPDWARSDLALATLPIAAVELAASSPGDHTRIGHPQARQTLVFRVYIFARHEVQLCEMLESLTTWAANKGREEISSRSVTFTQLDGQRWEPVSDAQQEKHAWWLALRATW
jgi:hypothetical protein